MRQQTAVAAVCAQLRSDTLNFPPDHGARDGSPVSEVGLSERAGSVAVQEGGDVVVRCNTTAERIVT